MGIILLNKKIARSYYLFTSTPPDDDLSKNKASIIIIEQCLVNGNDITREFLITTFLLSPGKAPLSSLAVVVGG